MSKKNYSVARVVTHTQSTIGKCERHNSLIERIEVHNNDKSSGHCFVKVDIYFTGVGMICIPTEEEVIAMMEEARKKPQEYRIVA